MTGKWLFRRLEKSRPTSVDYSHLPREITEKIIIKIECIKSIIRCTSVCKSWYVLIKSHEFINLHLSRPNTKHYFLCTHFYEPYYSIRNQDSKIDLDLYLLINVNKMFSKTSLVKVRGCCNGLICYTYNIDHGDRDRNYSGFVCLWNPFIRKLKILPNSLCHSKLPGFGFWVDVDENDYKVPKIAYMYDKSVVEVYSLSTDSWNIVSDRVPGNSSYSHGRNLMYATGKLYWLASRARGFEWVIISLDLKNGGMYREKVVWPQTFHRLESHHLFCGLRFGLILVSCCGGTLVFDENLNKLYIIDPAVIRFRVLGIGNEGEVLVKKIHWDDPEIHTVSVENIMFKDLGCLNSDHDIYTVKPFVQSLVLLNDGDCRRTYPISIRNNWESSCYICFCRFLGAFIIFALLLLWIFGPVLFN